jgi:hypothetical protein
MPHDILQGGGTMALADWATLSGEARREAEAAAREQLREGDVGALAEAVAWFGRHRRASDRGVLVEVLHQRGDDLRGVAVNGLEHDLAAELAIAAAQRWGGIHMGLRLLLRQELLTEGRAAPILPWMQRDDADWVAEHWEAIVAANPEVGR